MAADGATRRKDAARRGEIIRDRGTSMRRWLSLQPYAHAGSSLVHFSAPKKEAIHSSETYVQLTRSTRRHIQEDGILPNHRRENLKSYYKVSHSRTHFSSKPLLWEPQTSHKSATARLIMRYISNCMKSENIYGLISFNNLIVGTVNLKTII
jgi:hypothetical protein